MGIKRDPDRRLLGFARELRREATDAERRLWAILRDRQLATFKFRRQYPMAGYILDFYCVKEGLAVEVDGGQHSDPQAKAYDEDRTRMLGERGVRVLRFQDDEVLKYPTAVAEAIAADLAGRRSDQ